MLVESVTYEMAIALVFKDFRKKTKTTQAEIGDIIGSSKQNVSNIEAQRANLTIPNLLAYCEHFGIKPSEFFVEVEKLVGQQILLTGK